MARTTRRSSRRSWSLSLALALLLAAALAGCAYDGSPGGYYNNAGTAGEFGATQGGVQDMGPARELIAAGVVPPAEAFLVEGIFSEHDLPVEGAPCESLLCLRGATAIAPDHEGEARAWLQVGMSSTIDPATFERPSTTVIAVVDVSGSMGWATSGRPGEGGDSPGEVARSLLASIAAELGPEDRIAIVTYGEEIRDHLALTAGDDRARVDASIEGLGEGGVTRMEEGMVRAYEVARAALWETEQTRLMLFTDAQPNVGATTPTYFEELVRAGADDGIGITVFGLGLNLGVELYQAMAHLRGGNAFSLFAQEDVPELLEESWPWMVSPIAYDLSVALTPTEGYSIENSYGFPGPAEDGAVRLEVATVFLSRKRGALLIELAGGPELPLSGLRVGGDLSYRTVGGELIEQSLQHSFGALELVEAEDGSSSAFEQEGVARAVALALLVRGMGEAAELYRSDRPAAIAKMEAVAARVAADAAPYGEEDPLAAEVALAEELLELMRSGASQGSI